ncbi:MAG: hypothetical protein NT079_02050 [Candidatus Omnitrophica bacterium]|nr:hypothetical protein [Candidatus Omnitrophota bacterium]
MNRKLSFLIIFLLAVMATSGCVDKRPKYKNLAFEFMIYYTPGWEVKERIDSAIVAFLHPSTGKLNFFRETLTITLDDLEQPVTLNEYTSAVIEQVKAIGEIKDVRVNIIESSEMKISGKPGHKLVYSITQYGNPPKLVEKGLVPKVDAEGTTVQMMLAWTIREQRVYILTYVAQKQKYKDSLKDVEAMIQSFRFL